MADVAEIIIATTLRGRKEANGVQTQFFAFSDYLNATGHPVRIVSALSYHPLIVLPAIAMRRIIAPFSRRMALRWHRWARFRLIRAALRKVCGPGEELVIYAQDSLTAEAALDVRSPGQRVALAMHNTRSEADEWVDHGVVDPTSRMYESMLQRERVLLPRVDKLVFTSESQQASITSIFPEVAAVPSAVIPEFVDRPAARGAKQVPDAVTVGALEQRKNHRFLIDVIASARDKGQIFTLTIVGEGPERDALQALVHERGVEEQVSLIGRVEHDIGLVLERHRIYLHASRRESFGLAVVEALAAGVPTLIGATGVAELLRDGIETWIWPDLDDPDAGADLLISIMADDRKLSEVAAAGKRRYEESFSIEKVAPRLTECLLDQPAHSELCI